MAWAACERAIQSWTLPSAPGPRTGLARPCSSLACPRPVLDLALTFPDAAATPETSGPRAVTTDVFGERPPASAHPHRVGRYAVTGIAHADGSHRSIHRLFL